RLRWPVADQHDAGEALPGQHTGEAFGVGRQVTAGDEGDPAVPHADCHEAVEGVEAEQVRDGGQQVRGAGETHHGAQAWRPRPTRTTPCGRHASYPQAGTY